MYAISIKELWKVDPAKNPNYDDAKGFMKLEPRKMVATQEWFISAMGMILAGDFKWGINIKD